MKVEPNYIQEIVQQRKQKIDLAVKDIITSCLILNLPVHDQYYIERRLREVLQEAFNRVHFQSREIAALRKKMLKTSLKDLIKKMPPKKEFNNPKDSTEERDKRCEPIVYEVAQRILNEDLLLSEEDLIVKTFEEQQGHSLFLQVFGYVDAFFNLMELSMEAHVDVANKIKWGGKDKEQITFQDVDRTLKDKK